MVNANIQHWHPYGQKVSLMTTDKCKTVWALREGSASKDLYAVNVCCKKSYITLHLHPHELQLS